MTFTSASGTITQTGTDADLSGLNGVTGVTRIHNGRHFVYHLTTNLYINGTLTIDPQIECLFMNHKRLWVNNSGTLNFGVTSVVGGATKYSRATGLISADASYSQFLIMSGGTFNWNGGAMKLHGGADFKNGSTVNITNGIIVSTSIGSNRLRMNTANCSVDGLSIDGNLRFDVFKTFVSFNGYNSSFTPNGAIQKVGSSNSGGTDDPYVLTDFDAQGIQAANGDDFIGSSYKATKIEFVNMGFTGDFNIAHDGGSSAVTTLYKDIKLKIVDTNLASIEGAKYWATDKDNNNRFSGTASWRGGISETFSADRIYTGSTDLNGEAATRLLTRACYGGVSPSGVYGSNTGTIITTIDHRSETTDNTDVFNFYVASYGHTLNSASPSCIGKGVLEQQVVLFADVFLTESDRTVVDAYTEIDTPQKFYDRAKSFLVDNYAGEADVLISRDGNTIDAGSYDVVVDASASSVFAISGNTLTIKATTFVGNISTSGTTNLSSGAEVIGTFGATTVLPWEVKNVEATTRIQLYNLTKDSLVVTQKLSGTPGNYVDATGTYNQTEITVGDIIRLRCTCVVGAEAMLPVEITGVATSTGITFSVSQVPDQVYNSNGINGSTVSTLTADYSNPMGVDVSDVDGIASVKEIYAFFVYSTTTEDGVHLWFGGMRGIDNANYEVLTANSDIKIQNIGSNAVVVSDGRIYRDDGTSVLYAVTGDKPISMDSGSPVASIQPQMEASLNNNTKVASIDKKLKLIPGLL